MVTPASQMGPYMHGRKLPLTTKVAAEQVDSAMMKRPVSYSPEHLLDDSINSPRGPYYTNGNGATTVGADQEKNEDLPIELSFNETYK